MLGETVLGRQVSDVRTVLAYLRDRAPEAKFTLWGEGLVEANPKDRDFAAPLDAENLPRGSEPMGAHVALLTALFEKDDVDTVHAAGGFLSYRDILNRPYFYAPHDAMLAGVLNVGDVTDFAAWLRPQRVQLADRRDALNHRLQEQRDVTGVDLAAWLVGN
jgi:hypothetical protein